MKKTTCMILVFLLAFLMIFSAGCGGKQDNAAAEQSKEEQTTEKPADKDTAGEEQANEEQNSEKQANEEQNSEEQAEEDPESQEAETAQSSATGFEDFIFDTTDLDGNPVHSTDIFGQHRITMVNVWATWCGPCVGEMPELAQLESELAKKDCGLIGICLDAENADTIAEAKSILSEAGAEFTILVPFAGVEDLFKLYAIPTTFFVDGEGHVLCDPIVGADPDQYRATVDRLLAK